MIKQGALEDPDVDASARRRVLDRIRDEVQDRLLQQLAIEHGVGQRRIRVDHHLVALLTNQRGHVALPWRQLIDARNADRVQLDHSEGLEAPPAASLGTVGAVACDSHGHLAAATSTGGMTNKKFGRIGDTPLIGAGTYADGACAVSGTGHGEYFMRGVTAYDVAARMKHGGVSLADAAQASVDVLTELQGDGGLIAVDTHGNVALPFNSEGMYRGFVTGDGKMNVEIYGD